MADPAISIPDIRRANKAQVAQFFDISLPTVETWIRQGAPVAQRGARGVSWVIDLLALAEWRFSSRTNQGGIDPETLPPGERKLWYDGETKRRELQVRDRELIPVADVEQAIATAFSAIAQGIRSIPDNLERRIGCSPDVAEAVERILDEEMTALSERLADLAPVTESDDA
ncbi:MAG: DUF1441 family protein [Sphingobacterium sp.]|nr:DUF1441 family protein [Sphingobacterium sp.]